MADNHTSTSTYGTTDGGTHSCITSKMSNNGTKSSTTTSTNQTTFSSITHSTTTEYQNSTQCNSNRFNSFHNLFVFDFIEVKQIICIYGAKIAIILVFVHAN